MTVRNPVAAIAALALFLAAGSATAQDLLRAGCRGANAAEASRQYCELAVSGAQTLQAHVAIASSAGNPVPGTASTLGLALGPLPRMSLASRFTVSHLDMPPVERRGSSDNPDGWITSFNLDGSVALFKGFSLASTVGGFLSVDLLGNVGYINVLASEGFDGDQPIVWAAGARVGITRESFTAPGISVSAMYRNLGEVTYGDSRLSETDAFIHLDDYHVWNLRAAATKRLELIGLTGGVGYDIHRGDILLRIDDPGGTRIELREEDVSAKRFMAFGNVSASFLILTLSAEVGWQPGRNSVPDTVPGAAEAGNSAFFGSFAIRLSI